MRDFTSNLLPILEEKPNKTFHDRRLIKALKEPKPNKRQKHMISAAEDHAKALLGHDAAADVDWSKVNGADWRSILPQLIAFIMKLLSLFA